MFCPECGQDHHAAERAEREAAEAAADREVEIERLRTKRDIEVARITAGAARDISETEAVTGAAHADGVVEGVGAVLGAAVGQAEPDADDTEPAEGEPVVVDAGDEPEPGPDVPAPPEVPAPKRETSKAGGWWAGYR